MILAIFLGGLAVTMFLGLPVSFALLATAILMMAAMDLLDPQIVAEAMFNSADSFPLMAIPFFLLAGELMSAGGLSRRIVDLIVALLGHIRGGLGYAAILAAVLMASLSGSAVADTAALGAILIPMMRNAGYDPGRSAGLVAAGGVIAPIIPPSIAFIIFGVTANVSIIDLFLSGIAPGIMMGLSLVIAWVLISRGMDVDVSDWPGWRAVFQAVRLGFWAVLMPVIVVGGLKFGIFTPTEASAVAVAYAFLVGGLNLSRAHDCPHLRGLSLGRDHERGRHVPGRGCRRDRLAHYSGAGPFCPRQLAGTVDRHAEIANACDCSHGSDCWHGHGFRADRADPDAGSHAADQDIRH